MKGDGGTRVLQGEWMNKPMEFCRMLVFWYSGGGIELVLCILSILLGSPWKGDITLTSVSSRHQMWGSTFSTLWQFLQPQLPRAVSL